MDGICNDKCVGNFFKLTEIYSSSKLVFSFMFCLQEYAHTSMVSLLFYSKTLLGFVDEKPKSCVNAASHKRLCRNVYKMSWVVNRSDLQEFL